MSLLAARFAPSSLPDGVRLLDDSSGLTKIAIDRPAASGAIFLQGAHLVEWQPAGSQPVLFVSRQSYIAPGKAIRGGVPICFPWFGNRTGHPESPAHGFARTTDWSVESVSVNDDTTTISFGLTDSPSTQAVWPHAFRATYRIAIGKDLVMTFEVENTDREAFSYEVALHTYFVVSDVAQVKVTGLEQTEYIDKVDAFSRKRLGNEPLGFSSETDRVFVQTTATTRLIDPGLNRTIVVEKEGSNTTVVWNPWIAKAKAMADFGDDEWPGMLCIETANAGDDAVTLGPGARHAMIARIRLE